MPDETRDPAALPRDLGDGLRLRRATVADTDALATFNAMVFEEPSEGGDSAISVGELLRGDHPRFGEGGFTLVEDQHTGAIVSSLCLIPQTWTYAGIPFEVGRPELVVTHPEYRGRGLIRTQFSVIHAWGEARGEKLQAITGIPYYYRQFGYEPALASAGGRIAYASDLAEFPTLEGATDPFNLRPATEADIPLIGRLYDQAMERSLVACVRDRALWHHELIVRNPKGDYWQEIRIIERATGAPVGLLIHTGALSRSHLHATVCHVEPGVSWLAVAPSVLRALRASGEAYAARDGRTFSSVGFDWAEHPIYQVAQRRFQGRDRRFFLYIRIPNLPDFIRHIAPALERRLVDSPSVNHTGDLTISFYRSGIRLAFTDGRLTAAEPWQPTPDEGGQAAFPDLTFLQLLLGARSMAELEDAFPDCWAKSDEARALLTALFTKQQSSVWPVG